MTKSVKIIDYKLNCALWKRDQTPFHWSRQIFKNKLHYKRHPVFVLMHFLFNPNSPKVQPQIVNYVIFIFFFFLATGIQAFVYYHVFEQKETDNKKKLVKLFFRSKFMKLKEKNGNNCMLLWSSMLILLFTMINLVVVLRASVEFP